jgi:hypothetical protein
MQNPRLGGHINIFRYNTKELRSVTTQDATNSESAKFHLPSESREATPRSDQEVPCDVAVQSAREGTKGGKRRRKQHSQGATTMTDYGNGNNKMVGGSDMGRITTTTHSDKRQARVPIDHFKRLLEQACPNNKYPMRRKHKDCDMMKSFMISGSLTQGTELDEDLGGSDMMPFLGENIVMTVYDGCCLPEKHHVSKLRHDLPSHCG